DRMLLIGALTRDLAEADATQIIAAFGSTPEDTAALTDRLQDRALAVILRAFPAGHGAVIVSRLGITRVGTDTWLPRVGSQFDGKGIDAAVEEIGRELGTSTKCANGC